MNIKIHISAAIKALIVTAAVVLTAMPVFAVPNPLSGTATPNGRFIYVPDASVLTGNRIRVVDANLVTGEVNITNEANVNSVNGQAAVIQNLTEAGDPWSLVINKAGTYLFAVISADPSDNAADTISYIKAYSIGANGMLTEVASLQLESNSYPRGCALTASEGYLYVADLGNFSGIKKIRRIKVDLANATVSQRLVEQAYIPVSGANMGPYGVAAMTGRLYVTNDNSTNGKLMVYDISTENSPVMLTTIEGQPQASLVKISPDSSKVFVRLLDKDTTAGTFYDVNVYNTSDNSLYANIRIPSPGNHQVTGYNSSTGYSSTGNNDEDEDTYDASMDFSPDGSTLYFTHYIGESGDGMWHYNIKIRAVNIANPSLSWEANAGVGFHSTDSMVFTSRNRLWTFYSNGGYVQATPFLGPDWITHYLPTSSEVTVAWATAEYSSGYQVEYVRKADNTVGTVETNTPLSSILTLETSLLQPLSQKLLVQMSTYEVRVRTVSPLGELSQWTNNQYVTPEMFYTLEQVWLDTSATMTNEATLVFGPIISTDVPDVPYADHYELWYRALIQNAPWTSISVPRGSGGDPTKPDTYILTDLVKGVTYEAIMRSVDPLYGHSDWSNTLTFEAIPSSSKWCGTYLVTSHEAVVDWGTVEGATAYQVEYKATTEANWHLVTVEGGNSHLAQYVTTDANPNIQLTGLIKLATYEVQVQALEFDGVATTVEAGWCKSSYFYTLERPWVDFYKPGDHSVYIVWGPEVSINDPSVPQNVPQGVSYQMQYRTSQAEGGRIILPSHCFRTRRTTRPIRQN